MDVFAEDSLVLLTELERTHTQTDDILTDLCHLGNEAKLITREKW